MPEDDSKSSNEERVAAAAPVCTYEGKTYQVGDTECFTSTKTRWKCGTSGQWFDTKTKC